MKRILLTTGVFCIVLIVTSFTISTSVPFDQGMDEAVDDVLHNQGSMTTTNLKIVIDYSHGQYSSYISIIDNYLDQNLTSMGFDVVWAWGGINSSVLENAFGLIIGSFSGLTWISSYEIDAIQNWFDLGNKFLWVSCDSDYESGTLVGQFVNDNMSVILESVGSHVYPESVSVYDPVNNAGIDYRVIANTTTGHPLFNTQLSQIVEGVDAVLCHDPTFLYASNSTYPGVGVSPVALDETHVENIYPVLFYSPTATILDHDNPPPLTHEDGESDSFVAATIEVGAGIGEDNIIVVSGASPYGDYMPMYADEYYGYQLNGYRFVNQLILYIQNYIFGFYSSSTSYSVVTFDNYMSYQGYLENGYPGVSYLEPGQWSEVWYIEVEENALEMVVVLRCPEGTNFDLAVYGGTGYPNYGAGSEEYSQTLGDDTIVVTTPESGVWSVVAIHDVGRGYYNVTATITYSSSSTESGNSSTPSTSGSGFIILPQLGIIVTVGSLAVIVIFSILIIKNRR